MSFAEICFEKETSTAEVHVRSTSVTLWLLASDHTSNNPSKCYPDLLQIHHAGLILQFCHTCACGLCIQLILLMKQETFCSNKDFGDKCHCKISVPISVDLFSLAGVVSICNRPEGSPRVANVCFLLCYCHNKTCSSVFNKYFIMEMCVSKKKGIVHMSLWIFQCHLK